MRQLILYIIFMVSMVFIGHSEVSAASNLSHTSKQTTEDRLQKVEHKDNHHDAQLEDASMQAYRVCNSRPQRLSPTGNMHANNTASRLLFHRTPLLSFFHTHGGNASRQESAPIHFDVASKYYVICLRHLRC